MNEHSKTIRIILHDGQLAGSENVFAPRIRGRAANAGPRPMASDHPVRQETPEATTQTAAPSGPKRYLCPHCGAMLETAEPIEGLQVPCPECGAVFVAKALQKPNQQVVRTSELPHRKKTGKSWTIGMLGIALLAIAVGSVWWFKVKGLTLGNKISTDLQSTDQGSFVLQDRDEGPASSSLISQSHNNQFLNFGGRVPPDLYSFSMTTKGLNNEVGGNPIYFGSKKQLLWIHYVSNPGEGHIFTRRNFENYTDAQLKFFVEYDVPIAILEEVTRKYNIASGQEMATKVQSLWKDAFARSARFPAPVVFSFAPNDDHFLFINAKGKPSVLQWGVKTNGWFFCYEGATALSDYAKCLRELRSMLDEYTKIAQDEGLQNYAKVISVKKLPSVYIGLPDEGLIEKAQVTYEFVVTPQGKGAVYYIKETAKAPHFTAYKNLTPKFLADELEFFSRVETEASANKSFEPLYCFLSQKKILLEEASLEAKRIDERMEGKESTNNTNGKKKQKLTFSPIGKQNVDAKVELEATAESGGKVVFSVESGPGKITGNTLTFTGTGTVELQARQWGNEHWFSATATQSVEVAKASTPYFVEVKSTGGNTSSEPQQHARSAAPVPTPPRKNPLSGPVLPEFVPLAKALEAAKRSPTGANYKALMTAWEELPKKQKDAASKPVLWAFCAMLMSHGHAEAASKRQHLINYKAFLDAVSDPCHDCEGRGNSQNTCRVCAGSGIKHVRCSTCNGLGNCLFCQGRGQTGGVLSAPTRCLRCAGTGRCPTCLGRTIEIACPNCRNGMVTSVCHTCNGTGRIVSASKCDRVTKSNIEDALRICHGESPASAGDNTSYESDDWGFGDGWN